MNLYLLYPTDTISTRSVRTASKGRVKWVLFAYILSMDI